MFSKHLELKLGSRPERKSEKKKEFLQILFDELSTKKNSQFSELSYISNLSELKPLSTTEMHYATKELITSAENEVIIQLYKFQHDSDSAKIFIESFKILKEKAELLKKTISIKIIINSRGRIAQTFYKKNGVNDFDTLCKQLTSTYFKIEYEPHKAELFGSYHSKYIIVDGKRAMMRSTDASRSDNFQNKNIHESAMLVDEQLAKLLRSEFRKSWLKLRKKEDMEPTLSPSIIPAVVSLPIVEDKKSDNIPCIFISKKETENPLTKEYGPLKIALLSLIKKSDFLIQIMTANLNDPEICFELAEACNRGVKVQIMTGKYYNDSSEKKFGGTNSIAMAKLVSLVNYNQMKNLQIRWTTDSNGQIVRSGDDYSVHSKYACIDKEVVITGSSPLDRQSMYNSRETDIIFRNKGKAQEFNAKFFNSKFATGTDYFKSFFVEFKVILKNQIESLRSSTHSLDRIFAKKLNTIYENELSYVDPDLNNFNKILNLLKEIEPLFFKKMFVEQANIKATYSEVMKFIESVGIKKSDIYIGKQIELESLAITSRP